MSPINWKNIKVEISPINRKGGSSSLEAQINECGALMLLSTMTSLMGKAGEETAYFLSRQQNWP